MISTPEFGGACAFATSLGREGIGDPVTAVTKNGKTYYFQNGVAKMLFHLIPGRVRKAHSNWDTKS
jgi:hypothetical protein